MKRKRSDTEKKRKKVTPKTVNFKMRIGHVVSLSDRDFFQFYFFKLNGK